MIEQTTPESTAGTDTWRESVREYVDTAWEALDRAQIVLYRHYANTHDAHVAAFKRRLTRATAALIDLAVDEVYPRDDTVPTNDPGEAE